MNTITTELIAFVIYFAYGSFFEWFFHRYCFHAPKMFPGMFKAHTMVHHQVYKGDDSYEVHGDEHPEKVTMAWWALPGMIGVHLPLFFGIQWITHLHTAWGGIAAVALYYTLYESLHWVMHVPESAPLIARSRVFRFLSQHHKVHHKYMLSNLNVILPFADLVLGTLRDANGKRVVLFAKKPQVVSMAKKKELAVKTVKYPTKVTH